MRTIIRLLLVILPTLSFSQSLNFNQFGIEDGLPQSGIHTIVQGKQGDIWMGTISGVSKYNGITFENFSKKNGLAENRTISGCIDKKGNLWFGHWAGGITKYNPVSNKFLEVIPGNNNISSKINVIFEDSEGNIWFGTNGQGLLKYSPAAIDDTAGTITGKFSIFTTTEGMASNVISSLIEDKGGVLYIGGDNGITKLTNTQSGYSYQLLGYSDGLISLNITSLMLDIRENIWAGTSDKGVFRINSSDKSINTYNTLKGLANDNVKVIFQDKDQNIFIGTYGGGVSKYLPELEKNNYTGPWFQTISTTQGLSNDKVLCIMQDREKNIWIGTALNANQYFDEQFEIYGVHEGLAHSLVWSVLQDSKGNFWLGTEGGLKKMIPANNSNNTQFISYSSPSSAGKSINTSSLCEDEMGHIWYSEFGHGATRLDPATNKSINYSTKNGLGSDEVYSICSDGKGGVWIATNKGGVSKFDVNTATFTNYSVKDGLGSNQVYTIFKDSKGNLWFGVLGGFLTMYDGKTFKKYSDKDGYKSQFTISITEDDKGNMWFGTYENGLYSYDGKEFKNYTSDDGASTDSPFMLVADKRNNLWIGTSKGIDKFNLNDKKFKHYSKEDGFLGIEINPNAAFRDKEGNLWFGSLIGLVKYNSRKEKNNLVEPVIYLKSPRLFFEKTSFPSGQVFSYDQNHITFDFVGASLTNPKRVKYQYKLEGLDQNWSPVIGDNYVTYPNLPPGDYEFKVIAANNDGIWNSEPATYKFTIKPPFYKTPWFYAAMGILLVILVIAYMKFRERKLRKENLVLEQKVTERTEELRKEKENVEQQKIVIENKNLNIKDSIDYAKRIQDAIFVSRSFIKKTIPQSFILFRPKDIVSGDFYWMQNKDGKILFAAADCTGHGVPGAFMSIISYNLLNRVVMDEGVTTPSKILDRLNKLMFETLSYNEEGNKVKDGMDISLCSYDARARKLEFAGAYNSLYHVSKGNLNEIKADKQPIGKSTLHGDTLPFINHSIDIKEGDMVYLFSDGYADQVGGETKRKFFYGPFRALLSEISNLPLEQQNKKLDDAMNQWLGNREQVDDILVMGVKF